MAIINSYTTIAARAEDLLLIVDVSEDGNPTRTTTVNDVLSLIPGGSGGGGIVSIESSNTNFLSITSPSGPIVTLNLETGFVSDGGNTIATTGDIYDFTTTAISTAITNLGSIGTVTGFSANFSDIPGFTSAVNNPNTTPELIVGIVSSAQSGEYLDHTGSWSVPTGTGSGTVQQIVFTSPLTGGTITNTGTVGITQATNTTPGYLSSTNWNTFNDKMNSFTVTNNGTSGAAVFNAARTELNIPIYTGGGGTGGVVSVGLSMPSAFLVSNPNPIIDSGVFNVTAIGSASTEYIAGNGTLADISSIVGDYTWFITDGTSQLEVTNNAGITIEGGTYITTSLDTTTGILKIDNTSPNTGTVTSVGAIDSGFLNVAFSGGTNTTPITTTGVMQYSLSAVGIPNINKFLRGDNKWAELTNGDGIDPILNTDTGSVYDSKISVEYEGIKNVITSAIDWTSNLHGAASDSTLILNDKKSGNIVEEIEVVDILRTAQSIPLAFSIDVVGGVAVVVNSGNINLDTQDLGNTIDVTLTSTPGIQVKFTSRPASPANPLEYMVTSKVEPAISTGTTYYFQNCGIINKTATTFEVVYSKQDTTGFGPPQLTNLIIYK